MKKKLKDLTDEEMNEICRNPCHNCTCEYEKLITCPLWNGECMKGFIKKLRFVNKEIDL